VGVGLVNLVLEGALKRTVDARHTADAAHALHPEDEVAGMHLDDDGAVLVEGCAFADRGTLGLILVIGIWAAFTTWRSAISAFKSNAVPT
jgi:hypothetical protein